MASIFTHIIAGDLPGHFVWKDELAVAFMTIQPIRPGHLLVVPRLEVDQWDDLPEEQILHLMRVSRLIAHAQKTVYGSARVALMIAGFEVPHTHLHVLPADAMADLSFDKVYSAEPEELLRESAAIRAALRRQGRTEAEF
jgi:diadenosine tetraphosphate (Ap4A) HIT family hydrolase